MNPLKVILILVLAILVFRAITPTLTRIGAEQEKTAIEAAIMENSHQVDPRPSCAGAYGEELKNLAIQYGYCKK